MGGSKSNVRRKFMAINLTSRTRETSNKQPNFTHKGIRKRRTKKISKVGRRKEIINIRAEINEKDMKATIAKINKTKNWFSEKIKLTNR